MNEMKKAIRALGFRSGSAVTVKALVAGRSLVSVNGQRLGIWDAHKKTFVD